MKRGKSGSSSGKSSSGGGGSRFSGPRDSDSDHALPLTPEVQTSPLLNGKNAAAAAVVSRKDSSGSNYLVGLAGRRELGTHIQNPRRGKKWKDRVMSWEERAGIGRPSVKLALGFLDVLGVSRASVYKHLRENALRALLDKVPHLNEESMLLLIKDSFRYASQPELKSVPLKIITSMSTVPDKVLEKIVELQTHEPVQFEELGLPLPIKRLAWEKNAKLFARIASPAAEKYVSSEFAPRMITASQQIRFYARLDTVKRRGVMGEDRLQTLSDYTERRPILLGYLCDEIAQRYKAEPSLARAGLWATLLTDVLVAARERSNGSMSDPVLDRLCALASRLDLAVREDAFGDAAVKEIQRLFREATGISIEEEDRSKTKDRVGTSSSTSKNRGSKKAAAATVENAKQKDDASKLDKILKTAWSEVTKMDTRDLFRHPVTEAIAPGYDKLIKRPMDLSTSLKKIRKGGYHTFGDFDHDLKLMWKNCRTFNGPGTLFYEEAIKQEEGWSKMVSSFEETLREQEDISGGATSGKHKAGSAATTTKYSPCLDPLLFPMAPATQLDGQGLGRRVGLASILLSEPFAAKIMYRYASDRVPDACRRREILPRDHPTFAPLLQLLELGDAARAMFRADSFGVRAVEEDLMRKVLPCVVALHARAQDAIRRCRKSQRRVSSEDGRCEKVESEGGGNDSAKHDAADEPGFPQDWKEWYKEFPVVRRLTCTMLCRALVEGCDEAAALLMPAAVAAVKRMPDELWLWASLREILAGGARGALKTKDGGKAVAKAGKKIKADPHLLPETMMHTFTLFSRGLESAACSDAVFGESLKCITSLLPMVTMVTTPPPGETGKPTGVTIAVLEEIMDRAVTRAARPPRTPRTGAEVRRVKDALEAVFAKAPSGWREKFAYNKKKKTLAAAAVGSGAGAGAGGKAGDGRPPRPPRSFTIKGPKRKAVDSLEKPLEAAGSSGASVAPKKRIRVGAGAR